MNPKDLTVIIPFHSNSSELENTVHNLLNSPYKKIISKILLCHNGANLLALENAKSLLTHEEIELLHTPRKGLGSGCKMGIEKCNSSFLLITANDLPFGLTDISIWSEINPCPDIVIGSKLHPNSKIFQRSILRKLTSSFFLILKKILIPIKLPKDTQGTIFIKTNIAKNVLKYCTCNGFFFTTELVTFSILRGSSFSEVPIVYFANEGISSVSAFKVGLNFLKNLIKLRATIKREQYDFKK